MTTHAPPKLLDTVALVEDLPDHHLIRGQVGAIVEIYKNGEAFEVEFVSKDGQTYAMLPLLPEQFLVLRYQAQEAA